MVGLNKSVPWVWFRWLLWFATALCGYYMSHIHTYIHTYTWIHVFIYLHNIYVRLDVYIQFFFICLVYSRYPELCCTLVYIHETRMKSKISITSFYAYRRFTTRHIWWLYRHVLYVHDDCAALQDCVETHICRCVFVLLFLCWVIRSRDEVTISTSVIYTTDTTTVLEQKLYDRYLFCMWSLFYLGSVQ